MIKHTVEVETMKELEAYQQEGYKASISDISAQLGISIKKARELTKDIPRVDIKESLYHRLKHKEPQAYRAYFNDTQVFKSLIKKDLLHVYFYSPKDLIIFNGKYIYRDGEVKVNKEYLLDRVSGFHMLLRVSKGIKDIILDSEEYEGYTPIVGENENMQFMNETGEVFLESEIISKSDIVKYTRAIQRNFYIKFKIGEANKRGKVKYFQSIRTEKVNNLDLSIDRWMKEYKASGIE